MKFAAKQVIGICIYIYIYIYRVFHSLIKIYMSVQSVKHLLLSTVKYCSLAFTRIWKMHTIDHVTRRSQQSVENKNFSQANVIQEK